MSEDPTTEIGKELAKQLPLKELYQDAASPAAKQLGQTLEDIAKVISLAAFPLQFLGAVQDRYRRFLDESVRRVPEKQRISPAPQILGPVIEGLRFEPEGSSVEQMFSELLSRSMDSERVNEAHPSYPIIIRQLSADEAKILAELARTTFKFVFADDYHKEFPHWRNRKILIDEFPRHLLMFPDNLSFYMEHLEQLGLASLPVLGNGEPLYSGGAQTGLKSRAEYRLTQVGRRFAAACISQTTGSDKESPG